MQGYSGQEIGNYRLIKIIEANELADSYLGIHALMQVEVLIKLFHRTLENHQKEIFYSQARRLTRLVHPQILRTLEFGIKDMRPFLVFDYVPGKSLRQQHPLGSILPIATVTSYTTQIAYALQYAHEHGVLHRDIRPENILIGADGKLLLSGFVIDLTDPPLQSSQLLSSITVYTAPEQLQGSPVPASDQYSLAAVAYEWLNGQPLFQDSPQNQIDHHLAASPQPLFGGTPSISSAVEQVILRALAKDPTQRFADVQEFATDLERAGKEIPAFSAPPPDDGEPGRPSLATRLHPHVSSSHSLQRLLRASQAQPGAISRRVVIMGIGALLAGGSLASLLSSTQATALTPNNVLQVGPQPRQLIADLWGVIGSDYLPEQDQLIFVEYGGKLSAIEKVSGNTSEYVVLGTGYNRLEDVKVTSDRQYAYITERGGAFLRVDLKNANREQATIISSELNAPHQIILDVAINQAYLVEFANPGRLLQFDLVSGKQIVLLDDLVFAIGLLMSSDFRTAYIGEEYTEGLDRRITRFDLVSGERTAIASNPAENGAFFFLTWANEERNAIFVTDRFPTDRLWLIDITKPPAERHFLADLPPRPSSIAVVPNGLLVCCDNVIIELALP